MPKISASKSKVFEISSIDGRHGLRGAAVAGHGIATARATATLFALLVSSHALCHQSHAVLFVIDAHCPLFTVALLVSTSLPRLSLLDGQIRELYCPYKVIDFEKQNEMTDWSGVSG